MSFLVRAAFWLTVLAFLLPAAGYETATDMSEAHHLAYGLSVETGDPSPLTEPKMDAGEALTLVMRSAQDAMAFCGRNPDVCEKSQAIFGHVVRQTAHYGGLALGWLTSQTPNAPPEAPEEGRIKVGEALPPSSTQRPMPRI